MYQSLYEASHQDVLYLSPWWLDAVCGPDGWDAVHISSIADDTQAALPFFSMRIRGMRTVTAPPMTQWVDMVSTGRPSSGVLLSLFTALPSCSILDINLRPGTPWHFSEKTFLHSTQYSYLLPFPESGLEPRARYSENLRRNLRASHGNYSIESSEDFTLLQQMFRAVYESKKTSAPWWTDHILPRVCRLVLEQQRGFLAAVRGNRGIIAMGLFAHDSDTLYYLIGGRVAGEDGTAAHALLLDQAIEKAYAQRLGFDFEGSMVPGIAGFFQGFGASPVAYSRIRRFRGLGRIWSAFQ